ncbi:MAG: FliH/SctL family protein [Pseudomonadota bacterium]
METYLSESFADRSANDGEVFEPLFVDGRMPGATSQEGDPANPEMADAAASDEVAGSAEADSEVGAADDTAATDDAVDRSEEDVPPPEAEEPAPTFDQEAVEAARKEGFDEGFAAGREEAENAAAARSAKAMEDIATAMAGIDQDRTDEIAEAASDALTMAVAVVRKLFPTLRTKLADKEIRAFVSQRLGDAGDAKTLKIQVHEDLCEPITTQMTELAKQSGFNGTLSVQADPDLAPGDVRLDWREGGVERVYETLWTGLEAALSRSIGPLEPSAKANAARPVKKKKPEGTPTTKRPAEKPATPSPSAPQTA